MILTRFLAMMMGFLLGFAVAVGLLVVALDAAGLRPIAGADWFLLILTVAVSAFTASTVTAIDAKHPCPCQDPEGRDEKKGERQV